MKIQPMPGRGKGGKVWAGGSEFFDEKTGTYKPGYKPPKNRTGRGPEVGIPTPVVPGRGRGREVSTQPIYTPISKSKMVNKVYKTY